MNLHGVSPFDKVTGKTPKKKNALPSYTQIFAEAPPAVEIAERNSKLVAVTAAMSSGTGLVDLFQEKFPDRSYDVGIAEQHAVTFAAGLATGGYSPLRRSIQPFPNGPTIKSSTILLPHLPVIFAHRPSRSRRRRRADPSWHFDLTYLRAYPIWYSWHRRMRKN